MSDTTQRPNPIELAETLRVLANLHIELGYELSRTNQAAGPGSKSGKVPLDLEVVDARRAIDTLAVNYAEMLLEESADYEPPDSTPDILRSLADRIGHFTHHEDALIAFAFADEVETCHTDADRVAHPDGKAWVPLDRKCIEDDCTGAMRVRIDRDRPMDQRSLALWQPTAVCDLDGRHRALAKLLRDEPRVSDAA